MSTSNRKTLWDPIRSIWVEETPEERVRQSLLKRMVVDLGFPQSLLSVEREIASFPHLSGRVLSSPERRVDLFAYAHVKGQLHPLLLIECKAQKIDRLAMSQAFGYNSLLSAPFLGFASENEVTMVWQEREGLCFVPFLPRYQELVERLCQFW